MTLPVVFCIVDSLIWCHVAKLSKPSLDDFLARYDKDKTGCINSRLEAEDLITNIGFSLLSEKSTKGQGNAVRLPYRYKKQLNKM